MYQTHCEQRTAADMKAAVRMMNEMNNFDNAKITKYF